MTQLPRLLLLLTLALLLIGLAAHTAPDSSLCECTDGSLAQSGNIGLEGCLVCQLQNGVALAPGPGNLPEQRSSSAPAPVSLKPLEYSLSIIHPPISL